MRIETFVKHTDGSVVEVCRIEVRTPAAVPHGQPLIHGGQTRIIHIESRAATPLPRCDRPVLRRKYEVRASEVRRTGIKNLPGGSRGWRAAIRRWHRDYQRDFVSRAVVQGREAGAVVRNPERRSR